MVLVADAVALAVIVEVEFVQVISAPGTQFTVGFVLFEANVVLAVAEQPLPACSTVTE